MTEKTPVEKWLEFSVDRDRSMRQRLDELTLLVSELVTAAADDGTPLDRETIEIQTQHLHERLWRFRHYFGFSVNPIQDGES